MCVLKKYIDSKKKKHSSNLTSKSNFANLTNYLFANLQDIFIFVLISAILIFLDQVSKFLVRSRMSLGESIPLINNIFHLTFVFNQGAAFGILQNMKFLFIFVAIFIIGVMIYYFKYILRDRFLLVVCAVVFGGTVGNLIDRILFSKVIDFFDFRIWPVFNVADMCLSIGIVLLIIYFWRIDLDLKQNNN